MRCTEHLLVSVLPNEVRLHHMVGKGVTTTKFESEASPTLMAAVDAARGRGALVTWWRWRFSAGE